MPNCNNRSTTAAIVYQFRAGLRPVSFLRNNTLVSSGESLSESPPIHFSPTGQQSSDSSVSAVLGRLIMFSTFLKRWCLMSLAREILNHHANADPMSICYAARSAACACPRPSGTSDAMARLINGWNHALQLSFLGPTDMPERLPRESELASGPILVCLSVRLIP